MYTSFDSLPGHSRVWIYQTNRALTLSEESILSDALSSFTDQWMVHGEPMKASFAIHYHQFVIMAADEGYNAASGCSIDSSVRTLKAVGVQLGIDFFDRTQVAFVKNEHVQLIRSTELKKAFESHQWNGETMTFNNLVSTKDEVEKEWMVPAKQTWLAKYLGREAVQETP